MPIPNESSIPFNYMSIEYKNVLSLVKSFSLSFIRYLQQVITVK